jgi:hypothetical protein
LAFTGHHQIAAIISVFLDVFDDPHDTDEVPSAGAGYLVSGESRRTGIEIVDLLRSGRDGKIQDLTVFSRPLPASGAALRLLGGGLGQRQSWARGAFTCNLTGYVRSGAAQPTASSNPLCDLHHRITTRTMTAGCERNGNGDKSQELSVVQAQGQLAVAGPVGHGDHRHGFDHGSKLCLEPVGPG